MCNKTKQNKTKQSKQSFSAQLSFTFIEYRITVQNKLPTQLWPHGSVRRLCIYAVVAWHNKTFINCRECMVWLTAFSCQSHGRAMTKHTHFSPRREPGTLQRTVWLLFCRWDISRTASVMAISFSVVDQQRNSILARLSPYVSSQHNRIRSALLASGSVWRLNSACSCATTGFLYFGVAPGRPHGDLLQKWYRPDIPSCFERVDHSCLAFTIIAQLANFL